MLECDYGGVPTKLKQPVNWEYTTSFWILRFMLSDVAISIVFQCLRIIELFSSKLYVAFDSLLAITNASIYALLPLRDIQTVKEAAKTTLFLTDMLRKFKISILLLAGFRFLLVFPEFLLVLMYQPPIDWPSLFPDVVCNLSESLTILGALWCLIHAWMYGTTLQHKSGEII